MTKSPENSATNSSITSKDTKKADTKAPGARTYIPRPRYLYHPELGCFRPPIMGTGGKHPHALPKQKLSVEDMAAGGEGMGDEGSTGSQNKSAGNRSKITNDQVNDPEKSEVEAGGMEKEGGRN